MTAERPLDPDHLGDHLDRLYRAAWALCGSQQEAEDLVQDTYVRVIARPRFLRNEDDLSYLLRALRNTFLSNCRKARRRPLSEPLEDGHPVIDDHCFVGPEEAAEARLVYAAIAALPQDCREVLVAVDVAGLSYSEAARTLRLRVGTVTSRLYRARQQVVRRLEGSAREAAPAATRTWRPAGEVGQHARVRHEPAY